MRKLITVIIAASMLSLSVSAIALGNSYSLKAENGKLNTPAGIGLDVQAGFSQDQEISLASLRLSAALSYGIRPSVTVSGEVSRTGEDNREMLLKAYYSPSTSAMGYTAYLGYNLTETEIPMYGVSFWLDSDLLYGFVNLEANQDSGETAMLITPGANVRLGSRIRLAGEVAYQLNEGYQEFGVGASYELVDKFNLKAGMRGGFASGAERTYGAGLTVEI